jgi:hypothetical protein
MSLRNADRPERPSASSSQSSRMSASGALVELALSAISSPWLIAETTLPSVRCSSYRSHLRRLALRQRPAKCVHTRRTDSHLSPVSAAVRHVSSRRRRCRAPIVRTSRSTLSIVSALRMMAHSQLRVPALPLPPNESRCAIRRHPGVRTQVRPPAKNRRDPPVTPTPRRYRSAAH